MNDTVLVGVAVVLIATVFFIVALSIGVNLIGKNVFGQREPILPRFIKWLGSLLVRWIPVFGDRIRKYLAKAKSWRWLE